MIVLFVISMCLLGISGFAGILSVLGIIFESESMLFFCGVAFALFGLSGTLGAILSLGIKVFG